MRAFGTDSQCRPEQPKRMREAAGTPTTRRKSPLRRSASVTGGQRRQFSGILGQVIAAPNDVHVGANQNQISLVDRARRPAGKLQHAERHRPSAKRLFQRSRFVSAVEVKQSVTQVRNSILDWCTVLQPNMWQSCSWPTGRLVIPKQVLGSARDVVDDGRVDVAIAKFSANHLVDLALFDGSNLGKVVAGRLASRGIVNDFRTPLRLPFAVTERRVAR